MLVAVYRGGIYSVQMEVCAGQFRTSAFQAGKYRVSARLGYGYVHQQLQRGSA